MADDEELSYEESDGADSLGSSKSESELSLSCEFSSFEGGSSGSQAADGEAVATVEPYQYEPLDSHSSGGTDSAEGSSDKESAGAEGLNTEWWIDCFRKLSDARILPYHDACTYM